MAADYNAKLIADLYHQDDPGKAADICDDMAEIGDPIFPRQIFEAYKKFKHTSFSHYYIADLITFESQEVFEIIKEVSKTVEREADIIYIIEYFTKIEHFDKQITKTAFELFKTKVENNEIDSWDIESFISYFVKSGINSNEIELLLKLCFENDTISTDPRKTSIKLLLKINSKYFLNYYYENFDKIKGGKAEIILTSVISTWSGGIIPKFHELILKKGSKRAQEIIINAQSKSQRERASKENKEQETIKANYQTSDVVSDIGNLRAKINNITTADPRIGFAIFSQVEEIYQQSKPADTKQALIGYCTVIRSTLGNFNEKITEIKMNNPKTLSLLPKMDNLNGSINKFHYLLIERGFSVDADLHGLRKLHLLTSKFAHSAENLSKNLISVLKTEGLFELYSKENWSELHREILNKYKKSLEMLLASISS